MAAEIVTSLCSMVSNKLILMTKTNTHKALKSFIGRANMLVLDKSIVVGTGAIVRRNVLPHDGTLLDGADLTKEILQLCLVNVVRHMRDIHGSQIDVVLSQPFLVGVTGRCD